jgi:hypothetical protein
MEDNKDSKDDEGRASTLDAVADPGRHARERISRLEELAQLAGELAQMDFDFLFDEAQALLAIGYNVGERRRMRATTTCWPRRRASPVSWRSRRAKCRRRAGSRWGAC